MGRGYAESHGNESVFSWGFGHQFAWRLNAEQWRDSGMYASEQVFKDRIEAGRQLGERLKQAYADPGDAVVLALPRGGVPVAAEVARILGLPLDLLVVRKLGFPGQEELAMGAIASGGATILNRELLDQLAVSESAIQATTERERAELHRRERLYRGDHPLPRLCGRTVILVDDGLATGSTMRAAIAAVMQSKPEKVIVAVPVAPPDTVAMLSAEADDIVALNEPEMFLGVGRWYRDFSQTNDDEVRDLLSRAWGSSTEAT